MFPVPKMWIGGEWTDSASRRSFAVSSPATEAVLDEVPRLQELVAAMLPRRVAAGGRLREGRPARGTPSGPALSGPEPLG